MLGNVDVIGKPGKKGLGKGQDASDGGKGSAAGMGMGTRMGEDFISVLMKYFSVKSCKYLVSIRITMLHRITYIFKQDMVFYHTHVYLKQNNEFPVIPNCADLLIIGFYHEEEEEEEEEKERISMMISYLLKSELA